MNETNSLYKLIRSIFFMICPPMKNTPVFLTTYDLFPVQFIEVVASLSSLKFKCDLVSDILSLQ